MVIVPCIQYMRRMINTYKRDEQIKDVKKIHWPEVSFIVWVTKADEAFRGSVAEAVYENMTKSRSRRKPMVGGPSVVQGLSVQQSRAFRDAPRDGYLMVQCRTGWVGTSLVSVEGIQ